MIHIIRPRCGGKTTSILHLAERTGAIVVCYNPVQMRKLAQNRGFSDDIRFISYRDFIYKAPGTRENYLIDEIDGLLRTIYPNVLGYSFSPEDKNFIV